MAWTDVIDPDLVEVIRSCSWPISLSSVGWYPTADGMRPSRAETSDIGHVDGLDRRNRSRLGRGAPLLQLAHLAEQRRLVPDGRRHAAEQGRDFRYRARRWPGPT